MRPHALGRHLVERLLELRPVHAPELAFRDYLGPLDEDTGVPGILRRIARILSRVSRILLRVSRILSRGRAVLDQYLADDRIRPVSTIDVPSVSLLLSYVSGGLGIGLVPALALAEAPLDRVVSAPAQVPVLPVTLVWRPAARRQPALARLAALLATAGARAGARLGRARRSARRAAPVVTSP